MKYIILDACVMGDFFTQYFSVTHANRGNGRFSRGINLSSEAATVLNLVLDRHISEGEFSRNKVVITPLGMIELCRKWDSIINDPLLEPKVRAFMHRPPAWIIIASWDETILTAYLELPESVLINAVTKPIEWTDAVYPATAITYGRGNFVASSDGRIKALASQSGGRFVCV